MAVSGLSHLTFVVRDLDRTTRLFVEGLGAQEVYASGADSRSLSPEKFFLLGGIWIATMQGEPLPARSYRHVAFAVTAAELPGYRVRLEALGVEFGPSRPRIEGEGESLYFHDFDNHLFELHAGTLEARLQAYRAAVTAAPLGAGEAKGSRTQRASGRGTCPLAVSAATRRSAVQR